jgi:hypothetical protein
VGDRDGLVRRARDAGEPLGVGGGVDAGVGELLGPDRQRPVRGGEAADARDRELGDRGVDAQAQRRRRAPAVEQQLVSAAGDRREQVEVAVVVDVAERDEVTTVSPARWVTPLVRVAPVSDLVPGFVPV